MNNNIFDLYVAYELLYENKMSKKYKDVSLYPDNWYRIYDYQFKIDTLIEAIYTDTLICNTKTFQIDI